MKYRWISMLYTGLAIAALWELPASAGWIPAERGMLASAYGNVVAGVASEENSVSGDNKSVKDDGDLKENGVSDGGASGGGESGAEVPGGTVLTHGGIQEFLNGGSAEAGLSEETLEFIRAAMLQDSEDSEETEEVSEYANLAISNVNSYVNIRALPSTDGEVVGKIYHGAVAQILETAGENGEWFRVISGNAEGYIKAEYFLYGEDAAAVIEDYVTRYAVVIADRLNVRKDPDITSGRIGYIDNGEKAKILENLGDWVKVQYTQDKTGYVAAEYVTVAEEFNYAKTLEEEAAELAARRALEARAAVSEREVSENTAVTVTPPSGDYSTNEELRTSIVDYAMQYLGNVYIHGGQTLAGGTDCSGFTSLIYAEFGYSVSRTPGGQLSGDGRSISYSEAQPGDIICYGKNGRCTHVALYMGDGQIIHSANSRKGVVIYNADYDTIIGVKNIID